MIRVDYNYLQNIVAITTISAIFFYGNRKTNSVPAYGKTRPDRKRSWTPEKKTTNEKGTTEKGSFFFLDIETQTTDKASFVLR